MYKKILLILAVVTLSVVTITSGVLASTTTTTSAPTPPGVPTLTSTAFLMAANLRLTNLDGTISPTYYSYVDLKIATDVAGAVVGTVDLYPTIREAGRQSNGNDA